MARCCHLRTSRRLIAIATFALVALGMAPRVLHAQTFDATALLEPTYPGVPWLIQAGDDPAWAQPGFDDSHWPLFDPHDSLTSVFPHDMPPVIWYRLHVKVDPTHTGLALDEWNLSRAFEIYVNGERLIESGQMSPFKPYTTNARILKRIPDRLLRSGSIVIAMRVHLSKTEWVGGQNPGYYVTNLQIGQESTLENANWLAVVGGDALGWVQSALLVGLGLVALMFFKAERVAEEYKWVAAWGLITVCEFPEPFVATWHNIPVGWEVFTDIFRLFVPYVMVSVYFSFVNQKGSWGWKIILAIAGMMNMLSAFQGLLFVSPLHIQLYMNLPFIALLAGVVPIVLATHWRQGNHEAGILLIPVGLFSLYIYAELFLNSLFEVPLWRQMALRGFDLIDRFPVGPFAVSLNQVSGILSTISLTVIMILRSTRTSRQQAQMEAEIAAAREVQHVIVPESSETVPGFKVESVYEPAQQVGGDFYQILPTRDGGMLVVIGDVAGKGLPAAMLVSVLVGATRGVAEYTSDPAELLTNLNERLVGRAGGGFSTALVARIDAHGEVTIANAGHLPPYFDGMEVPLPGALPLGVKSGTRYETVAFKLPLGSRLTFYSDGIVEAQNAQGELFGFERSSEMSLQPVAAIVKAAKEFGQQDDMTVVAITRDAAVASAA
ncbi:MAG: SpoIIE family protein phosphatase [Terracidiphilus sp.]